MSAATEWRRVLRAAREARGGAFLGPRTAARAAVAALAGAPPDTCLAVACVLASQTARQAFDTDLRTFWRELKAADRFRDEMKRRAPVRHTPRVPPVRRDPLPVDAAKAVSLVELLARYGHEIRRVGSEWVTRCPFHDDRRPSLTISPSKGLWFCHPCGVGGDGIAYVMQRKGIDFAAAVREVAA